MFSNQLTTYRLTHSLRNKPRPTRHARRLAWGVTALALLAVIVVQVQSNGGGWLALGFALMPDLGLVAGMSRDLKKGQLAPRAVPLYNALHRFLGPVILAVLVFGGVLPQTCLAAPLGWGLHIAIDRAVGYGLRGPDGFQRG